MLPLIFCDVLLKPIVKHGCWRTWKQHVRSAVPSSFHGCRSIDLRPPPEHLPAGCLGSEAKRCGFKPTGKVDFCWNSCELKHAVEWFTIQNMEPLELDFWSVLVFKKVIQKCHLVFEDFNMAFCWNLTLNHVHLVFNMVFAKKMNLCCQRKGPFFLVSGTWARRWIKTGRVTPNFKTYWAKTGLFLNCA